MNTRPLLDATELRRSYGARTVVDVDRLHLERGEILAVLGANGSGKSTLFRLLLGLERPDAGRVETHGATMAGVFQKPFLFRGSVRDNLGFGILHSADKRERIADAAEIFGIAPLLEVPVAELSDGEAQRVALARAIALRPDILLLDEPTASLDVLIKRSFRETIERAARARAGAVVLITHDPAEAFTLADRIAVMDAGRIVQTGTPEDLLDDPRTPFIASFSGADLLLDGEVAAVADELAQVGVGGVMVWAVVPADRSGQVAPGDRVHVAYRPEDVTISTSAGAADVSARNQYRLRIASLHGSGALVRVRLQGSVQLNALLTRASVEALGLRADMEVVAHMKATALRVLRSA